MTTTAEEFQRKLADLQQEYLRLLPAKVGEIESGWNQLLHTCWDTDQLRNLHRNAHSLVGSGATFGHPSLSQSARALEQVFKTLLEQKQPADAEIEQQIENMLMKLRESVLLASRELPATKTEAAPSLKSAPHRGDQTRRVFLVEDDEMLARDLILQLNHFGYAARGFHTLADLRQALRTEKPDAIVMDILMPDGDSTVALTDLQTNMIGHIPVIYVTSHPDFESRLRAVRAGAEAYLIKPVDIGELVDKLDRLTGIDQPAPYRVLVIDDSPVLSEYYALILRQAGMLVRTNNVPARTMSILEDFAPDLILMDAYMPECDGFELAMVLRQQEIYMGIPIVFLSSETNLDKQLQALGTGADDFLTKPIMPHHLVSAVTTRAQRARMLQELMVHDSLTGLLNHTTVKDRIEKELAHAARQRLPVSLAMLDIDHFKLINDNYGHLTGDRVIKSLARLLLLRLRKSDLTGRYGGEEFIVLMHNSRVEDAVALLDQMRHDFSELRHQNGKHSFNATFSAGITAAWTGAHASAVIEVADRALYEAKNTGRNRIVLAKS